MSSVSGVAEIFNRFYASYSNCYVPFAQQAKAAKNIMQCKTAALGAHVYECEGCGHKFITYNS